MNYTQNYHLPQWVREDRIMMEDFNAMNSSIEAGLTRTEGKADTAVSTANAANQTAGTNYGPDNKPYAVGSYVGNGGSQTLTVGFRPSYVIICMQMGGVNQMAAAGKMMAAGSFINTEKITITDTGFRVSAAGDTFPPANSDGSKYEYIAFR